jgi:hypothetical protein
MHATDRLRKIFFNGDFSGALYFIHFAQEKPVMGYPSPFYWEIAGKFLKAKGP